MADALERFEQAQAQAQAQQQDGKKDGSALVASLVQKLSGALVNPDVGNAETNRRLWDRYAEAWGPKEEFVATVARHTVRTAKQKQEESEPSVLGEEWSSVADLEDVLARYLFPCLHPDAHVAEIGVGGGRVARYVRPRCAALVCMDLSANMLRRAEAALLQESEDDGAVLSFVQLDPQHPAAYPDRLAGTLDVVFAFDVLVHVDLHIMYQVFKGARLLLKPGGKAFFSTANLLTPAGWRRFERQSKYTAAGFYFVCPDMVDRLLAQAGFRVVQRSAVPEGFKEFNDAEGPARCNLYEGRDYLVVVEAV